MSDFKLEEYQGMSDEAKGYIEGTHDRAMWLHYLLETAAKLGTDVEALTDEAIFKNGKAATSDWTDVKNAGDFARTMADSVIGREAFKATIVEENDEHAILHFKYCPLVAAWEKEGLSKERIADLCRHACKGDQGRASNFPITLAFPKQLAKGDEYCELDITTVK
jgi:hypothetical protein